MLIVLIALIASALTAAAPMAFEISLPAEIRARQEVFIRSWHFADETDRSWIRLRSRAGVRIAQDGHAGVIMLNNEHRHYLAPDGISFDWEEIIIEHAYWRWQPRIDQRVTIGRQDIVWPGGFLMLDGNPLVGSRSMYHNALRLQTGLLADGPSAPGRDGLDLALIHNPKRDPLVLVDDMDRALCDADESALALRIVRSGWSLSLIHKAERDPDDILADLAISTIAVRRDGTLGDTGAWHAELAAQHQDGFIAPPATGGHSGAAGWAAAAEGAARWSMGPPWQLLGGLFYYSGSSNRLRPFRTPWGRWPKWSDLYVYTLIAESTPGRVHGGAWENIAAPHVTVSRPFGDGSVSRRLQGSVNATWLLAPEPGWEVRGLLTRTELKADFGPRWQGHLLWEMLVPGSFHDGRHGLPPMTRPVHFLRWQLVLSL
jgi:hypothetical protein